MTGEGVLGFIRGLRASETHRTYAQLSDRDLLTRFSADRDEGAFAALVSRHGSMVFGACRRALRNPADAEDVFQAAFLLLAKKAESLTWQESVANWLYLVSLRLARQTQAKTARRVEHEGRATSGASDDLPAIVAGRELQTVCDEELARLPGRYRSPIVLCCLEGLARDEAAEQLGWSLGTLKRRLEQGRELLRVRLARRGYTLSAALFTPLLAQGAVVPSGLVESTVVSAATFAAGRPAALLAVSANTADLTNGVLHAMIRTKLRNALLVCMAALGAVGATYGFPASGQEPQDGPKGVKVDPPAKGGLAAKKELERLVAREQERLAGRWVLESYTTDGVTKTGDEPGTTFTGQRRSIKGNRWVDRFKLSLADAADGDPGLPEFEFALDPSKSPKWIDYRCVNRPETWVGLGIYKLEGDELTICFRIKTFDLDTPAGKMRRPEAFEAKQGQLGTGLTMFKRVVEK